jgi:hypothetical protein
LETMGSSEIQVLCLVCTKKSLLDIRLFSAAWPPAPTSLSSLHPSHGGYWTPTDSVPLRARSLVLHAGLDRVSTLHAGGEWQPSWVVVQLPTEIPANLCSGYNSVLLCTLRLIWLERNSSVFGL